MNPPCTQSRKRGRPWALRQQNFGRPKASGNSREESESRKKLARNRLHTLQEKRAKCDRFTANGDLSERLANYRNGPPPRRTPSLHVLNTLLTTINGGCYFSWKGNQPERKRVKISYQKQLWDECRFLEKGGG